MTDLTDKEQEALATLTVVYPAGIVLTEDLVDAIAVCDELVESGHAVRIEGDDFEGRGYQLSPEMAAAHQQVISDRADQAELMLEGLARDYGPTPAPRNAHTANTAISRRFRRSPTPTPTTSSQR